MTAALEATNLVKSFGPFTAVGGVSFAVHPGEVVGLLGANGAGKTTTIRMLVGLLKPTRGVPMLLGGSPDRDARRRLGYVAQGLGLYRDLTVRQNLEFSAAAFGVQPAALKGDLGEVSDRLVGETSLGLQRQLAFMCAIQHAPDLLVLDEPTSGVEPLAAAHLWDQIRTEADQGTATLVSTHSMQEARQCDRLLLMAGGHLVAQGTETDIVGDTAAVEVETREWARAFETLGSAGVLVTLDGRSVRAVDASTESVVEVLVAAGVDADVRSVRATLEEKMAALSATETQQ